jgi:hypothetical protein
VHRAVQTRFAIASQALTAQAHTSKADVPACSRCLTRLTLSPLPMHINRTGDHDSNCKFCTSTGCRPTMPTMRFKHLLRTCACYARVDELIGRACAVAHEARVVYMKGLSGSVRQVQLQTSDQGVPIGTLSFHAGQGSDHTQVSTQQRTNCQDVRSGLPVRVGLSAACAAASALLAAAAWGPPSLLGLAGDGSAGVLRPPSGGVPDRVGEDEPSCRTVWLTCSQPKSREVTDCLLAIGAWSRWPHGSRSMCQPLDANRSASDVYHPAAHHALPVLRHFDGAVGVQEVRRRLQALIPPCGATPLRLQQCLADTKVQAQICLVLHDKPPAPLQRQ